MNYMNRDLNVGGFDSTVVERFEGDPTGDCTSLACLHSYLGEYPFINVI